MNEIQDENIEEQEQTIDRRKMVYKRCKNTYDFTKFKTIGTFAEAIRNGIIMVDMANDEQNQLAKIIKEFFGNAKLQKFQH